MRNRKLMRFGIYDMKVAVGVVTIWAVAIAAAIFVSLSGI